jgi:hypothetical protein
MDNQNVSERAEGGSFPAATCSVKMPVMTPVEIAIWKGFVSVYKQEEGFFPNPRDSRAWQMFEYFLAGATLFMPPNAKAQGIDTHEED